MEMSSYKILFSKRLKQIFLAFCSVLLIRPAARPVLQVLHGSQVMIQVRTPLVRWLLVPCPLLRSSLCPRRHLIRQSVLRRTTIHALIQGVCGVVVESVFGSLTLRIVPTAKTFISRSITRGNHRTQQRSDPCRSPDFRPSIEANRM